MKIRIVLVEDDPYIRRHFMERLSEEEEFSLVAAVGDAFEAEKLCGPTVDLVLMDVLTLHKHSGLAAGKRIRRAFPHIKVVIITSLVDPEVLLQAKQGCADSLWYKDHGTDAILDSEGAQAVQQHAVEYLARMDGYKSDCKRLRSRRWQKIFLGS